MDQTYLKNSALLRTDVKSTMKEDYLYKTPGI
jgi:hypothetical protein